MNEAITWGIGFIMGYLFKSYIDLFKEEGCKEK